MTSRSRNEILSDIVIASGGVVTNPNDRNQLLADWLLVAGGGVPGDSRIFIDLNVGNTSRYSITDWEPAGTFTIKFKFALSQVASNYALTIGDYMVLLGSSGGQIYVYPDISGDDFTNYTRFMASEEFAIDDIHEVTITGSTASSSVTSLLLDGVSLSKTVVGSNKFPSFAGNAYIGYQSGLRDCEAIIADVELIDDDDASNSPSYALGEATGNTENSLTNGSVATYISIAEGEPARVAFSPNSEGTQLIGDNGRVLTIKY